jgi:tetratricopeptide (TPR) repeat protein
VWLFLETMQPGHSVTPRPLRGVGRVGWLLALLLLCHGAPAWGGGQSELFFNRGVAAYGEGDYAAAREAFGAVIERDPDDADAQLYLGLIARQEGDYDAAIEALRSAVALDPNDVAAQAVLTETLLAAGRNEDARVAAERGLALSPNDPSLQLYAGIAEYRAGDARAALTHLDEAGRLDPKLQPEASYYTGLAQVALGNLYASAAAFREVEASSPGHLLGNSARSLREQMAPSTPSRIWFLSATAGVQGDTNPTAASKVLDSSTDVAGTFRLRGLLDAYRGGGLTLRAGYDGFLAGYANEGVVDEQTHFVRGLATYDYKSTSFALRYDYGITLLDHFTEKFRSVQSVQPLVNVRVGRWGVTQGFYQYQYYHYYVPPVTPELDQDGSRNAAGVNQFFLLDGLFSHARIGVAYLNAITEGSEFDYNGVEINAGGGLVLPWRGATLSALYRYARLSYKNPSIFPEEVGTQPPAPGEGVTPYANVHNLSLDLSVPVWRQLTASLAANLNFRSSQVAVLEWDRQLFGAYLTWSL